MKNTAKLGFIWMAGLLALTACDGSLISREQARQVLTMIQKAQQKIITTPPDQISENKTLALATQEEDYDLTRLYGEEIAVTKSTKQEEDVTDESQTKTWREPLSTTITYNISYTNKYVYYSYSRVLGVIDTKKWGYEYWYFLKNSNFYMIERQYDTRIKESDKQEEVEKKGTKNIEEASRLFMEYFLEYKTLTYNLLQHYDDVNGFINILDDLNNEPKQRLFYDSYHTKKNSHIVASITRYTSTSRDRKDSVLNFMYNDNLIRKYEFEDVTNATYENVAVTYLANLQKPATFEITNTFPTSESEADSES